MKFRAAIADNVSWITEVIHTSANDGVEIILFPECAVTGYHRDFDAVSRSQTEAALQRIARAACAARCCVLVGCPAYAGRRRFNSLVVFDRRGRKVFTYSKIHLTARDARFFKPGNTLAFFHLAGVPCTAIICHERRFPELVRLPVMLGAQIVFHPNAGLDSLPVSKSKRHGRDGMAVRAFENEVYYVFANSVGPQGDGWWSAGDSKIVASGQVNLKPAFTPGMDTEPEIRNSKSEVRNKFESMEVSKLEKRRPERFAQSAQTLVDSREEHR
jgi:predicted amidohydrolase